MFVKDRVSDLAIFERWVEALIEHIPEHGGEVDIMDLFYRLTLDVTTDFLLGGSVNALANPKDEFAEAFNDVQSIQMMLTMLGPFEVVFPRSKYKQSIKKIDRFVMPYIEAALALPRDELEKLGGADKEFTFLHSVARHTRDPQVLRDQIIAVLLAGRDTTAATLSWTFYELSRYPLKFAKLRREILDAVGRTRNPTYDDLKNMTYLRHVLNETLRLYPAVPYNLRTALEDTTLPGPIGHPPISIIEGDTVVYSTLSMQVSTSALIIPPLIPHPPYHNMPGAFKTYICLSFPATRQSTPSSIPPKCPSAASTDPYLSARDAQISIQPSVTRARGSQTLLSSSLRGGTSGRPRRGATSPSTEDRGSASGRTLP